jgi:peptide/nickel transport system ATP-binding protein
MPAQTMHGKVAPTPDIPHRRDVPTLLSVRDLRISYRTSRGVMYAVDGASFDVAQAEMVGLVGESGCGKTTAARALTGVLPANARIAGGHITFTGRDLLALDPGEKRALRWKEIAFVPQSAMNSLDPVYRVERQLREVLQRGGIRGRAAGARAIELLDMVGLEPGVLAAFPHQLSGGMRQRVAIALALALDPILVIADEPVTALDVIVQREVLDTLRDLQRWLRLSVIMITHDISVVAYSCDRIVVMYAGQVVESGPSEIVLGMPAHPYTMGLCNAFPDLERAADLLVPIQGSPPDLHDPPLGCRFAPRCPFAIARCAEESPPLAAAAPGHDVACWRATEAPMLRRQATEAATWMR